MNIGSIINQLNNAINPSNDLNAMQADNAKTLMNGMNALINNGDSIFSGKVVSLNQDSVVINLGDNQLLEARLSGGASVSVGDILSFKAQGVGTEKITLTTLFENTSQETTVNNALKAANMDNSPQNQYMVKSMMEEGLPIDRDSLYNMSKAMNMNATSDVLDLAKMTRLNIPLNEEMVDQFKQYQNLEHEVSTALKDITMSLGESFEYMIDETNPKTSVNFLVDSLEILLEEGLAEDSALTGVVKEDALLSEQKEIINFSKDTNTLGNDISNIVENKDTQETKVLDGLNKNFDIKSMADTVDSFKSEAFKEVFKGNITNETSFKAVLNSVLEALKNNNFENKSQEEIKAFTEDVNKLIKDDSFKKALNEEVLNKFLLEPEEVKDEGKVTKLYNRLSDNLNKLLASIEENGAKDTPLSKSVSNLNSNINFMNELNQTFNYVQIPLKMTNQNANGELYVYTNKKSLAQSDGNVSALLHLDMEYLGPMDVQVFLNANTNNVNTKFYLKDDSSLDLIANNIEILNSRLNKRGYNLKSEFINEDIKKSVMDNILDDNKNISIVSSGSFDARA